MMPSTPATPISPTYLALLAMLALVVLPDLAQGATAGGGLPYEGPLTQLRASVTGPVATTVSLIGIIGSFGALIFGTTLAVLLHP